MSKQTSQRIAVTFTVSAALLFPMFMQSAQAQTSVSPTTSVSPAISAALPTQSKDIIVVDAPTGTISKGLMLVAGAGNYLTIPITALSAPSFLALPTSAGSYAVGELVVPGGGFVTVPIYEVSGALATTIRVWDAKTINKILPPDLIGSVANLAVATSSKGETKPLRAWVLDQLFVSTPKNVTSSIRVFDYRTDPSVINSPDVLGTAANLSQPVTSKGIEKPLALWVYDLIGPPPVGVALATSFPKLPIASLLSPTAPIGTAVSGSAGATPSPASGVPNTPVAPNAPKVISTPALVGAGVAGAPVAPPASGAAVQGTPAPPFLVSTPPAALNSPPGAGQVVVPQPVVVSGILASSAQPSALAARTKVCKKSVLKFVTVGKKRVKQKICVKY